MVRSSRNMAKRNKIRRSKSSRVTRRNLRVKDLASMNPRVVDNQPGIVMPNYNLPEKQASVGFGFYFHKSGKGNHIVYNCTTPNTMATCDVDITSAGNNIAFYLTDRQVAQQYIARTHLIDPTTPIAPRIARHSQFKFHSVKLSVLPIRPTTPLHIMRAQLKVDFGNRTPIVYSECYAKPNGSHISMYAPLANNDWLPYEDLSDASFIAVKVYFDEPGKETKLVTANLLQLQINMSVKLSMDPEKTGHLRADRIAKDQAFAITTLEKVDDSALKSFLAGMTLD